MKIIRSILLTILFSASAIFVILFWFLAFTDYDVDNPIFGFDFYLLTSILLIVAWIVLKFIPLHFGRTFLYLFLFVTIASGPLMLIIEGAPKSYLSDKRISSLDGQKVMSLHSYYSGEMLVDIQLRYPSIPFWRNLFGSLQKYPCLGTEKSCQEIKWLDNERIVIPNPDQETGRPETIIYRPGLVNIDKSNVTVLLIYISTLTVLFIAYQYTLKYFSFQTIIFLNIILGILFWYMSLTRLNWTNTVINFLVPGFISLLSLGSLVLLSIHKPPRLSKLLLSLFFISVFAFGLLLALLNSLDYSLYEPNVSCKDFANYLELYSPDKSKEFVICDSYGGSGVINAQIHYLSFPYLRRDLVRETYQDDNNGIHNYYLSRWVNNDVLFTQDPSILDEDKMINLNVWQPCPPDRRFISAFILFDAVCYAIYKLFERLGQWIFSIVSKRLQKS